MKRIKMGKTVRIPDSAVLMMKDLRSKMEKTSSIGGLKLIPEFRLSDGVVIAFALAVALANTSRAKTATSEPILVTRDAVQDCVHPLKK